MSITKSKNNVYRLTSLGILTAIIIVLQIFTTFVRFGPFSITLALVPIVVGAAMLGVGAGAYLGAVFSVVVVIMCITGGDVGGFMIWSANPFMCVIICMLKGTMAGFCAGAIYKALCEKNKYVATIIAALAAPIVNTGIFIVGMLLFFSDILSDWAGGSDLFTYIILGLTGVNFLIEIGVNIVLSPIIVRIIDAVKKSMPQISNENSTKYGLQYFFSFLIPIVGFILGGVMLSKKSVEKKGVGKACLVIATCATVFYALIIIFSID